MSHPVYVYASSHETGKSIEQRVWIVEDDEKELLQKVAHWLVKKKYPTKNIIDVDDYFDDFENHFVQAVVRPKTARKKSVS